MANMTTTSYPERQLTTSLGEVRVQLHAENRGVILLGPQPGTDEHDTLPLLTINNIPHGGRVFIERNDSGVDTGGTPGGWSLKNFYVKRLDRSWPKDSPTDSCYSKLFEALKEALSIIATNNEFLAEGKRAGIEQRRQEVSARLAAAKAELAKCERELAVMDAEMAGAK